MDDNLNVLHGPEALSSTPSGGKSHSWGKACYSVVLPVYNERENLEPLLVELAQVLNGLAQPFEVIAVDDGSTDGSLQELKRLQKHWAWLRVVPHRFNAGQSAAFLTGFARARGSVVITMDADGQNDPHDLPAMVAQLRGSVAAVCGVRQNRQDPWIRRVSSRLANAFRNWITGDHVADAGCALRVLRRDALQELLPFNGLHRFLPTVLRYQGYEVVEVPVNHRPRTRGQSKYGIRNRLWRGVIDCLAMRWYRARALRADRVAVGVNQPVAPG
ncbi:MAG: glycosyltransferase family 2 protein [Verrucomicrobiota bacterium]|nr:glycosyltransferase family 2 protein [Limisphaera sp.]MDW8383096.1 glycosyltransferase family 2 protein [Verrucomicrobiota bacterium]